jgi:hypothetical protein
MDRQKKRRRSEPSPGTRSAASDDGSSTAWLLDPDLAPEWEPLLHSLSRLADCCTSTPSVGAGTDADAERRTMQGCSLVRVIRRALELQHRIDGTQPGTHADPLDWQRPLGEPPRRLSDAVERSVAQATRLATDRFMSAVENGHVAMAGDSARAALPDGLRGGPPTAHELLSDAGRAGAWDALTDPRTFRDAYMEVLADGAADELNELRSEDPPMDQAALVRRRSL